VVLVDDEVYQLPAKTSGVKIGFQFKPFLLEVDINGRVNFSSATQVNANATQIQAYIPLWGRRAGEGFRRYEQCFTEGGMRNEIVMTRDRYWGDRTLRAKDFEYELCSRLEQEVRYALRRFLKSYSTLSKCMHANTDTLYSLFMMPYPGRISYHAVPTPLAAYFLRSNVTSQSDKIDGKKVIGGIDNTHRQFSRFELQIFELNRLRREGNYAIALVGSLSLIEWVLRLTASPEQKTLPLSKLIDNLSKRGLSDSVREPLHELRNLRNVAVHMGEHADLGRRRPHEILELNVDNMIKEDTAQRAIELAWLIFQQSNSGTLIAK
jgi:hypothetical protein